MLERTAAPNPEQITSWYKGMEFTSDWVSHHVPSWSNALKELNHRQGLKILEIGCWEGRSAVTFLNMFPGSTITCVDPWSWERGPELMKRFDLNTAQYKDRVEKIQASSFSQLPILISEGRKYDFIYIDGDHRRNQVLIDSTLSWLLLKEGGYILWDDYDWEHHLRDEERPQSAIDWFLSRIYDQHDVVLRTKHLAIKKTARQPLKRFVEPKAYVAKPTMRNLVRFLRRKPI